MLLQTLRREQRS